MLLAIFSNLKRLLPDKKPLNNLEQLVLYLADEVARLSSGAVMSYAQKRTGKLHWQLVKDDEYSAKLINCQVLLNAEIMSDIVFLTLNLLKLNRADVKVVTDKIIIECHNNFKKSSPITLKNEFELLPRFFNPKENSIREFTIKTGNILYKELPFTKGLREDNNQIIIGQLRTKYINLLTRIDRKLVKDNISSEMLALK